MDIPGIRIQAWKVWDEGKYIACDREDPDACMFKIRYPGMVHDATIDIPSKYQAEWVERALVRCFYAGKKARSAELLSILQGKGE